MSEQASFANLSTLPNTPTQLSPQDSDKDQQHQQHHFRRQTKTVAQLLEHLGSRKNGDDNTNSSSCPDDELNNNTSPDEKRLVIDTDMLDTDVTPPSAGKPSPAEKKQTTSPRTINKKFSCRLCGKRFVHRQNLFAHENTHTGERPFRCIFCNKGFKCPSTLCKHKRCMHPAEMAKISPERRLGDTSIKHISLAREKRAINKDGCYEYPLARVTEMSPSPGNENDSAHLNVLNGLSGAYAKNYDHLTDADHKPKKIKVEDDHAYQNENKPFLFSAQNVPISPVERKPTWLVTSPDTSSSLPRKPAATPDNNSSSANRRKRSLSPDNSPSMPYQCHVCLKKFANSNSLNQHKYTHATDRSIQCNVCGRMFKHPGAMYRHRRTVHTEPAMQRTQSPASPNDQKVAQQMAQRQLMASLQAASMHGMALPPTSLGVGGIRLPGLPSTHQAFPADALALRDAYFTSTVAAAHIPQQFYLAQAAVMQAAMSRQSQLAVPSTHTSPIPENTNGNNTNNNNSNSNGDNNAANTKTEDDAPLNLVKPKESPDGRSNSVINMADDLCPSEDSNEHEILAGDRAAGVRRSHSTDTETETTTVRDRRKNTYPRKYLIPKATILTTDDEESYLDHDEMEDEAEKEQDAMTYNKKQGVKNSDSVTEESSQTRNQNTNAGARGSTAPSRDDVDNRKPEYESTPVSPVISKSSVAEEDSMSGSSGDEAEVKERMSTPNSIEVSSSCHPLHVQTQTDHVGGDDDAEFETMLSRWFAKRKLFECPHCKIIFREFSIFAMHFGMHVASNPLQCSFCGRHCKDKFEFLCHHS